MADRIERDYNNKVVISQQSCYAVEDKPLKINNNNVGQCPQSPTPIGAVPADGGLNYPQTLHHGQYFVSKRNQYTVWHLVYRFSVINYYHVKIYYLHYPSSPVAEGVPVCKKCARSFSSLS